MITKKEFFRFIDNFQFFRESIKHLEDAFGGYCYLWESDLVMKPEEMLDVFLNSHFTEEGVDWVYYWLYEDIDDKVVTVEVEGDMFRDPGIVEYHINSLTELWDFLLTDKELYFKNA